MNKILKKYITKFFSLNIKLLSKIFLYFGYYLKIDLEKKIKSTNQINLNIGAGNYIIDNFKSLDFYSDHYYPDKNKFLEERVEYDLRKDDLPFKNNIIDNIYASHILEHIEDIYVIKFLKESFRVLKPSGVLRIVCPDAKFLFNVSSFKNDYWNWRKKSSFSNKQRYTTDWNNIEQYDYLIRELSTPNCRFYNYKIKNSLLNLDDLKKLSYDQFKTTIKRGLVFRDNHPGDHINIHDFESLFEKGKDAGFRNILESKKNGSVSLTMQGSEFDVTATNMSLYVDMIK